MSFQEKLEILKLRLFTKTGQKTTQLELPSG
jgi:hypothetical protein